MAVLTRSTSIFGDANIIAPKITFMNSNTELNVLIFSLRKRNRNLNDNPRHAVNVMKP